MRQNAKNRKNENSIGRKLLTQKKKLDHHHHKENGVVHTHAHASSTSATSSSKKRKRKKKDRSRAADKDKEAHKESPNGKDKHAYMTPATAAAAAAAGHGHQHYQQHQRPHHEYESVSTYHAVIDEEIPKSEWKHYLKGRFISRDSIIVAPVLHKFNHEEAISDNFKAYGKITRINMWDDESAHVMYDKQYFADALVDKIQDVAVRYQGQFGLMSAKYHFRRPCEEFMDPERRCPMQCRKFHGPYYKIDFIPLDTYLDEEARDAWIEERRKQVAATVKTRYKRFRKKYMDNAPLPSSEHNHRNNVNHQKRKKSSISTASCDDDEAYNYGHDGDHECDDDDDEEADDDERYSRCSASQSQSHLHSKRVFTTLNGGNGHSHSHNHTHTHTHGSSRLSSPVKPTSITLKYAAMGTANKLLALDDSLQKHLRTKPHQPAPPTRVPPPPPANVSVYSGEETKSNSGSVGSANTKRKRPPLHHTTTAQMHRFGLAVNTFVASKTDADSSVASEYDLDLNGHGHAHGNGKSTISEPWHLPPRMCRNRDEQQMVMMKHAHTSPGGSKTVNLLKSLKKHTQLQQPQPQPPVMMRPNSASQFVALNDAELMQRSLSAHSAAAAHITNMMVPPPPPSAASAAAYDMYHHHHHHHHPVTTTESTSLIRAQSAPKPTYGIPSYPLEHMPDHPSLATTVAQAMHAHAHSFDPHTQEFVPSTLSPISPINPISPIDPINPKKSKLNANATEFSMNKQMEKRENKQPQQQPEIEKTNSNLKTIRRDIDDLRNFDIRNLGPLIAGDDDDEAHRHRHSQFDYDFGAALNESHLDLHSVASREEKGKDEDAEKETENEKEEDEKQQLQSNENDIAIEHEKEKDVEIARHSDILEEMATDEHTPQDAPHKSDDIEYTTTVSSDESSEDDDETPLKWTKDTIWRTICDMMSDRSAGGKCEWKSVRKELKACIGSDWRYVRANKPMLKQIKGQFRTQFEAVEKAENHEKLDKKQKQKKQITKTELETDLSQLLKKQIFRTSEANCFANLIFMECSVIDLDLRISDIRNYMTDLLSSHTATLPSQYDTTIIAELGQILCIYQRWIDVKNDELLQLPMAMTMGNTQALINHNNATHEGQAHSVAHSVEIDEESGIKQLFGDIDIAYDDEEDENGDDNVYEYSDESDDEIEAAAAAAVQFMQSQQLKTEEKLKESEQHENEKENEKEKERENMDDLLVDSVLLHDAKETCGGGDGGGAIKTDGCVDDEDENEHENGNGAQSQSQSQSQLVKKIENENEHETGLEAHDSEVESGHVHDDALLYEYDDVDTDENANENVFGFDIAPSTSTTTSTMTSHSQPAPMCLFARGEREREQNHWPVAPRQRNDAYYTEFGDNSHAHSNSSYYYRPKKGGNNNNSGGNNNHSNGGVGIGGGYYRPKSVNVRYVANIHKNSSNVVPKMEWKKKEKEKENDVQEKEKEKEKET